MGFILEACVDSVESAIEAKKGGAMRLELCSDLVVGGTSPSLALFELVKEVTDMKIHVLIRPRAGDFCYSDYEFQLIRREVELFKQAGADGVVIGVLKPDGTLDIERMRELVHIAGSMHITLHRAFDMVKNPYKTLEEAKALSIHTILTSGQQNHCIDGADLIRELVELSAGQVDIMVGSGVNEENIEELIDKTQAHTFHLSGKKRHNSPMAYRKDAVTMGSEYMDEYANWVTDSEKIRKVYTSLENILNKNE
jgi:copper homeostasis protein